MSISNIIKFNEIGAPPGHLMMKAKSCLSKKIN
jgi:hypothetical protein